MKVKLTLPLPTLDSDCNLTYRIPCEAIISKTWDSQKESPFYGYLLPNGEFRNLDIRLIIPTPESKPQKGYVPARWKISGTAKHVIDFEKNLVIIEVDPDGFEISNSGLGYHKVSVQLSPEVGAIKSFINHLFDAGWEDEENNFVEHNKKRSTLTSP